MIKFLGITKYNGVYYQNIKLFTCIHHIMSRYKGRASDLFFKSDALRHTDTNVGGCDNLYLSIFIFYILFAQQMIILLLPVYYRRIFTRLLCIHFLQWYVLYSHNRIQKSCFCEIMSIYYNRKYLKKMLYSGIKINFYCIIIKK